MKTSKKPKVVKTSPLKGLKISKRLQEQNERLEKRLKAKGHVVKVIYKYASDVPPADEAPVRKSRKNR
jgi:hypothetical protein